MGKPTICICEKKGADQLRGNREADQRLCFRYSDSTIPPKFQASSSFLCLYRSVCVGPFPKPYCWFSHEAAHLFGLQEKTRFVFLCDKAAILEIYRLKDSASNNWFVICRVLKS